MSVRRFGATLLVLVGCIAGNQARAGVSLQRVLPLGSDEGVYAYARVSPDGSLLAYSSETQDAQGGTFRTVRVIDLKTRRIMFAEPGIDAYWSPDGLRMIYLSKKDGADVVSIYNRSTGIVTRDVAPPSLGDYPSWASRDGRDLILTIKSNYYFLNGNKGELPARQIGTCPGIGVGARPLITKDGRHVSTFVRGNVVVRSLTDCTDIADTSLQGGKADFSWDGRYLAFHAPRASAPGYEIVVVDRTRRSLRRLSGLGGSSLFPSWTSDGRLCFRYDGPDFRGFMFAGNVLSLPESPLPEPKPRLSNSRRWAEIFGAVPRPHHRLNLVLVWAPWSAHSIDALAAAGRVQSRIREIGWDVELQLASEGNLDPQSAFPPFQFHLPTIEISKQGLLNTEAANQMPSNLLFRDDELIGSRLGAMSDFDLMQWLADAIEVRPQITRSLVR